MTRRIRMTMVLNGADRTLVVEPRTLLLHALREECGLTGTAAGCEDGGCGACTVLVDNEPVRACLMFAVQAHGTSVGTVEGLAGDGTLCPVQSAFRAEHAVQCGACTAGFMLLAAGALSRQPDMSDEAIAALVDDNICRCTGYEAIVRAITAARDAIAAEAE